ncbi:fumarylacetoacetate hydrolase family protein [Haloplanus sp. GCM10025708]|uniref:fumarylacetoacetate hydrolase family protein n=1 Tax=Haloferacaceae TaxID=1644056 RepID=UPI00360E6473
MRHVRFRDPAGAVRNGEWDGDQVRFCGETYGRDEVEILAPTEPNKIVCIGLNYAAHAAETDSDVPDRPMLFLKPPNTVAAHGDTVTLPAGKEEVDWEAELGVVVGEQCRHVAAENAADVIAGYTCVCDISNRDDQRVEQNWVRGKAFDGAAPMGPVVADPEHVPDDATVVSRINGETRQRSDVSDLIFSVPELIEEITQYMTLEPGDVISTGTPSGIGSFDDGDHCEIEVEGVGVLEFDVRKP